MKYRLKVAAAVLISLGATHARATGIPVIDVANLFQAVQQVINDITQINNQIQQIRQLQTQIESINGMRNLVWCLKSKHQIMVPAARATDAKMVSALLCHTNGLGSSL
ncbi:MAG: type IV secretion system protein [Burkholderiaceae bacterium]